MIVAVERDRNAVGRAERRAWGSKVLRRLQPELAGVDRVVILAGARYREFLVDAIRGKEVTVEIPLKGMRIGEQLRWLKRNTEQ